MGFNLSEPRILVTCIAEATDEEPLQRVALQFESLRDGRCRSFLEFFQLRALSDQAFDYPAGDASPLLADAIAQLRNAEGLGAARAIDGFGRDVETRHDAWELAYKV